MPARVGSVTNVSRIAHLDCVGGIAGDMLLAALLDAGASQAKLEAVPELLGIGAVEIRVERVERQGIAALHVTSSRPKSRRPVPGDACGS